MVKGAGNCQRTNQTIVVFVVTTMVLVPLFVSTSVPHVIQVCPPLCTQSLSFHGLLIISTLYCSLVGASLEGQRVLVVDDVITAGTAIRESVNIINAAGGTVAGVVVALDRQEKVNNPSQRCC